MFPLSGSLHLGLLQGQTVRYAHGTVNGQLLIPLTLALCPLHVRHCGRDTDTRHHLLTLGWYFHPHCEDNQASESRTGLNSPGQSQGAAERGRPRPESLRAPSQESISEHLVGTVTCRRASGSSELSQCGLICSVPRMTWLGSLRAHLSLVQLRGLTLTLATEGSLPLLCGPPGPTALPIGLHCS